MIPNPVSPTEAVSEGRAKRVGIRSRIFRNLRRVSPFLILGIVAKTFIFLPGLVVAFVSSFARMRAWSKPGKCLAFIQAHPAFKDVDRRYVQVRALAGGVSNANQIWTCRKRSGEEVKYFAKIFLPVGSYWAKHLSKVCPFPVVKEGSQHERFLADVGARARLAERDVAVPRLIAYDEKEMMFVTEFLEGDNVDEVMKQAAKRGALAPEDEEVITLCGRELARVHNAGYSLIDSQPVNCIWVKERGRVYFADLEYATRREDHREWDAGFFLCFLTIRFEECLRPGVASLFLEAYRVERPLETERVELQSHRLDAYLPILETILDIRQYTPEELAAEITR